MIQTQVRVDRCLTDLSVCRHAREEHRQSIDVEIDTRLPIGLGGFDDLGVEHLLIILRGRHRITAAKMDVVIAVHWHLYSPLSELSSYDSSLSYHLLLLPYLIPPLST